MWDDPRRMNALAATFVVLALAMLGAGLAAWLVRQPVFAWREVVVGSPLGRVRPAHVEAVVRDELTGTFFTMDLDRARAALARVPWVRKVALRRQWPQRLEVDIEEHVPFARWNDNALLNSEGEVFVADYDGELPQFAGPDGRARDVAARYREWGGALAPLGLAVRGLELSPRGGWRVTAAREGAPLTIEIGRDEPQARLERFIAAYGRTVGVLARSGTPIEYVDLRYRNGFAARVPGFKERPPKKAA
jgi:cell division protein FtsQ